MKKWLLLLIILLQAGSTIAQVPKSEDSLITFLKTHPKDTLYTWALRPYALIQIYQKGNQAKGDSIANELKILSEKLNYGRGLYFSYLIKAIVNQQRSELQEMLKNFRKCYEIVVQYKLNKYLQEATLNNISATFDAIGDKDSTMKYALLAINVQEQYKLPKMDAAPYEKVGNVLKFYKKYNEALKYYQKELDIATQKQEYQAMAIAENLIGNVYDDLNKHLEATKHYKIGLEYAQKDKYLLLQTDLLSNLGRMAVYFKRYDEAENYFKQDEKLCRGLESSIALKKAFIDLGNLYQKQKKYALAEKYFLEANLLTRKIEDPKEKQMATEALSDFYAETNNYAKAYQFLKDANVARDSAFKMESDIHTQELLTKYETEKKEQQIKLLDEEANNSRLKIIALAGGGLLAILLAGVTIAWVMNRNNYKQLEESQRLRNKIAADLHDEIGSTLSSISILSEIVAFQQKNNEYKPEIMMQVSYDAQDVIEKMDDIIWTINPENDAFYNLETRLKTFAIPLFESKDIDFNIFFSPELETIKIDMAKRRNIYLIMKEAINNLIKYSQCKNAKIEGKIDNKILIMKVIDDGIGFDTTAESVRNGQKNMRSRAMKIGADLGVESEIGKGTEISLKVK